MQPHPRTVYLLVFPPFRRQVPAAWARKVAELALASDSSGERLRLDLVIADDATVRELNRRYRAEDALTDVLSFPFLAPGEGEDGTAPAFPQPPAGARSLGEVIVSYPQARRQAREGGRTLQEEMALLITHGVLHLLGYDHADAEGERRMKAREAAVLGQLFSPARPGSGVAP